MERRTDQVFKNLFIPIVVSIFIGSGASFIATKIMVAVLNTEIVALKKISNNTIENMRTLDRLEVKIDVQNQNIIGMIERIGRTEGDIVLIKQTQYTDEDARKDQELLRLKIIKEINKNDH